MKSRITTLLFTILLLTASNLTAQWTTPEAGTAGATWDIVGTPSMMFASSSTNGVFISINQGEQWIDRGENLENQYVQALAQINNYLFVGTNGNGVYRSTNAGESWVEKSGGLGDPFVYTLVSEGNNLYALTDNAGVFMTSDLGDNWISLNNADIIGIFLYTLTSNNNVVYVGGQYGSVYKTSDKGKSWQNLKSGPLVFDVKSIAVDGDKIVVGTPSGVFISLDGGKNWKSVNSGLKNTDVNQVSFYNNLIIATTKGGIFISENNGGSWFELNDGLPDLNVLCIAFIGNYAYAGSQFGSVVRRLASQIKVADPTPPQLIFPPNEGVNINEQVNFSWREAVGATSYFFQLALSTDFSNPVLQRDNIQVTNLTQNLELGLTYYWRVGNNTGGGQVIWSDPWSFTVRDEVEAAQLIQPGNNAQDVPIPATFVWSNSKGTDSYALQISENTEFDPMLLNQTNLTDTSFTFPSLDKNTTYYWRVISKGAGDNAVLSDVHTFTTGDGTSYIQILTNDNPVMRIYPNPTSESANLIINIESVNSNFEIYSVNGSLINTRNIGEIYNETHLDISAQIQYLIPGVYYIKLNTGTRILILPFTKL